MNSIKLGRSALEGRNGDLSCSLIMESDIEWMNWYSDLPNLSSITSNGNSFRYPRSITLSSMNLNDILLNRYS